MAPTYANPVVDTDFPDPGIFHNEATGTWYAYSTNSNGKNVQCASSTDFARWTLSPHDALPNPHPGWTGKPGFVWAPEVVRAPSGRPGFLLYVTTHDRNTGRQSIAVGYSQHSPLGAFRIVSPGPIVSQGELGGTIDPQPFDDPPSGRRYLLFKNDGNHENTAKTSLWIQLLSEDGLSLVGGRRSILEPSEEWHGNLLEAPYMYYHAPSQTYALFYSANGFGGDQYATGYATSRSPFGPFVNDHQPLLSTVEKAKVRGPGGQSVVNGPQGRTYIVYHAWDQPGGQGGRRMCINQLVWSQDGRPQLAGPATYRVTRTLGEEAKPPKMGDKMRHRASRIVQFVKDY